MKNKYYRKVLNKSILLTILQLIILALFSVRGSAQNQSNIVSYASLVQQADQALSAKDYASALMLFEKARQAKPELSYSTTKISEINTTLDAKPGSRSKLFEDIIVKAENFYMMKDFFQAKTEYHKALAIDPSAQFPKDRLAQISIVFTDPSDQAYFNDAVANGDRSLSTSEFDKAILFYETALAVKPDAKAIKEKISNSRKLQAEYKIKVDQSAKIIIGGDKLLLAEKRTEARAAFQKVLDLTPDNQYAKLKIQEIDNFENEKKAVQESYDKIIDLADQFYINRDFANARIKYIEAQKVKPNARYPKEMLEKTKTGESALQSDQQKYDAAIASADKLFIDSDFDAALIGYKSASEIKPAETYPKIKITDIEKLIADRASRKDAFELAVKKGDKSLELNKYDEALAYYQNALSLLPGEKYPTQKVEEITTLLGQQKSFDENFKKIVTNADLLFKQSKYSQAISEYSKALDLKPGETYVQQQIKEAQVKLDLAKNKEEQYATAITNGDKLYTEQKFEEAITAYKLALTLKPAEKYPQEKIAEINTQLALQQKTDEQYTATIGMADHLFTDKNFEQALVSYKAATELKQNEIYPKDQIVKINKIVSDLHSADQNYTKAISDGDLLLEEKKFTEAITSYNTALVIKPTETYPKTQVEKANRLIAEQKKLDEDYLLVLTAGDQNFDSKKYAEAITDYHKALTLKPAKKYPLDKIKESENLIADLKAKQETYDKSIVEGDKKLAAKEYENALISFENAKTAKPTELYPASKITEIQSILAKIKAENDAYQEAIALADKFFAAEKFREALEPYQHATTVKPTEKYPQDQIARINQLLAEQKKLDDEYQILITQGETILAAQKYDEARGIYSNANKLKPSEKLPAAKIAEIDEILAALKLKDENYTKAVNTASELYSSKNLTGAIKSYEEAISIKSGEKYPQERISAIKAELKIIDDSYLKAVTLGDSKLASKNLMEALNAYQNALEIKPEETYPKSKIAEINSTLSAQKEEQDKLYTSFITEGDKLFTEKDYSGSKSAFTKATGIKPAESYPKQRITDINKIVDEIELARKVEYTKALGEADKLFNTKVFDQAIDAYEAASKINPGDSYPSIQIAKVRKYMTDHAIQDLYSQKFIISEGNEKKFTFTAIEPRLRKNNYILLTAHSVGKAVPKVYLNYGKDNLKNGAMVIRSLTKTDISDFVIRISVQDKWYREDNNWISLFVETGEIEIIKVQIAAGD